MKRIIYLAAINFLFLIPCAAQENNLCPTVKFVLPVDLTPIGGKMPFAVSLSEESKNLKLKYDWTVSVGKIVEGQGTDSIKVATNEDLAGKEILAIVRIKGLDDACKDVFFETAYVANFIADPLFPQKYELKPAILERATIDQTLYELTQSPDSVAIFYLYFKAVPTDAQINARISRVLKHFAYRKVPFKDRVIFVVEKSDSDLNGIVLNDKWNLHILLEREEIIKVIKSSYFNLKKPAKRK